MLRRFAPAARAALVAFAASVAVTTTPSAAHSALPCGTITDPAFDDGLLGVPGRTSYGAQDLVSADVSLANDTLAIVVRLRDIADQAPVSERSSFDARVRIGGTDVTVTLDRVGKRWTAYVLWSNGSTTVLAVSVNPAANSVRVAGRLSEIISTSLPDGAVYQVGIESYVVTNDRHRRMMWDSATGNTVAGQRTCASGQIGYQCGIVTDLTHDENLYVADGWGVPRTLDEGSVDLVQMTLSEREGLLVLRVGVRDLHAASSGRPQWSAVVSGPGGDLHAYLMRTETGDEFGASLRSSDTGNGIDVPVTGVTDPVSDSITFEVPLSALGTLLTPRTILRFYAASFLEYGGLLRDGMDATDVGRYAVGGGNCD